ncbi:MAG: HlyD family efflux transporter periplasmic adaptor subunit [Phycisphaerae bacterium]|nr:HlyD family efflux transporter periplasmic adaptor subunit [Phycisphaerae bacterium]
MRGSAPACKAFPGFMSEQRRPTDFAPTRAEPSCEQRSIADILALQCETAPAETGAIVRVGPGGPTELLALFPAARPGQSQPAWLDPAVDAFRDSGDDGPRVIPVEFAESFATAPVASIAVVPLAVNGASRVVGLYLVRGPTHALGAILQRLCATAGLFETLTLRREKAEHHAHNRARTLVLESLAAGAEHERFAPATIGMCNGLASLWRCNRASIGIVRRRAVNVVAMSQTEKIVRKTGLVQDIESAMEECADQDIEIRLPLDPADIVIARAHAELADRHGSGAILSLPLRHAENVFGVITLERDATHPFTAEEVEAARLYAELVTNRLVTLERYGRHLPLRLLEDAIGAIVGPRQTWLKLAAALVLLGILFLTFVPGVYRVESTFRIEAASRRVIPAPFDGYIREVFVEVGDELPNAGTPLARLDDSELRLQLASARAELSALQREIAIAQRDRKEAESQMARAKAEQAAARAELIEHQIGQSLLVAPEPGLVLSGDLKRLLGAPVRTGDHLFEVAQLDSLRADAYVPEDRIADIQPGQSGELATAAFPANHLKFTVERIEPAAELRHERNVFRVRLRLESRPAWLRPGMEGLARVDVGRRPYGSIWFRRAADWIRMKLWI